jgi:glutaredoxin
MSMIIYTATGCARCKIVKGFMEERGIPYVEKDMKAEGKEDFQAFYKANRSEVFRGPDGIEFPILYDGENIRQSIGAAIAFLHAGKKLDGFFTVGTLHKEWVNGIHISSGDPQYAQEFISVLKFLKGKHMKLQIETNGKNSGILRQVLDEKLADVMIMNVLGPEQLYSQLAGEDVDIEDIKASLALIQNFPEFKIQTVIAPVIREDGTVSYLTPEEIAQTAKLVEEGTGSKKTPYILKAFNPKETQNAAFKKIEPISNLLPYRSKARTYQVFADIEK